MPDTSDIDMSIPVLTSVSNIEKLGGQSNYDSWKFAVKMSLTLDRLWEIMTNGVSSQTDKLDKKKDSTALAKNLS